MTAEPFRYILSVDGREIELSDGEVTIGRSRTSTVRIDHESVSRSHALLTLDKGQAVVKDLNSSNGTYVGGRRVLNETRLSDGDRIQLGAAVIGYRIVWTTKSERTAVIDSELEAGSPPPAASDVPIDASPAAPASPDTAEKEQEGRPAAAPPPGPEPALPPPLEISAGELVGQHRHEPESPVAAAVALEAVRALDEPHPAEPPRPPLVRIPAPPRPAPPPPSRPAPPPTLASVPIGPAHDRSGPAQGPEADLPSAPEPAGFGVRLLAQLVDGVVLTAVNIVLMSPVFLILFFRGELQPREVGPDAALLVVTILCGVLMIAANLWYVVGGWAKSGRTPGKSLLRIAVVLHGRAPGSGIGWGPAFVRALGTIVSAVPLGAFIVFSPTGFSWRLGTIVSAVPLVAGYLVVLVRRDKRALHDLMAGTSVVRY